jgi:hypothetical protein
MSSDYGFVGCGRGLRSGIQALVGHLALKTKQNEIQHKARQQIDENMDQLCQKIVVG